MPEIRLYRQIYCFNYLGGEQVTKTLIDPFSISASTFILGSTSVEENLSIINEETGIYFVNLNPNLYSSDKIYELKWYVTYQPETSEKILPTLFKVSPYIIGKQIEIEVLNNNIDIQLM